MGPRIPEPACDAQLCQGPMGRGKLNPCTSHQSHPLTSSPATFPRIPRRQPQGNPVWSAPAKIRPPTAWIPLHLETNPDPSLKPPRTFRCRQLAGLPTPTLRHSYQSCAWALPQGLCTCCSLCLEGSPVPHLPLAPNCAFGSELRLHFLKRTPPQSPARLRLALQEPHLPLTLPLSSPV